jgi:uncharacterized protein (UPF0212 family)
MKTYTVQVEALDTITVEASSEKEAVELAVSEVERSFRNSWYGYVIHSEEIE